jgi:alkylhydroperoxidase family enzyme
VTPRIEPLSEPYPPEVSERLTALMPAGREPIRLFRTFVRNLPMAAALNAWGRYYLSRQLSLSVRDRELVIDRTTARCGCDYEWGVHTATYGGSAGLTGEQVRSIVDGSSADSCWSVHDAVVLQAVDALHDTATIDDDLWPTLAAELTDAQLLDLFLLAGWYHAISFAANAAGVEPEYGAPRLTDVLDEAFPVRGGDGAAFPGSVRQVAQ